MVELEAQVVVGKYLSPRDRMPFTYELPTIIKETKVLLDGADRDDKPDWRERLDALKSMYGNRIKR